MYALHSKRADFLKFSDVKNVSAKATRQFQLGLSARPPMTHSESPESNEYPCESNISRSTLARQ